MFLASSLSSIILPNGPSTTASASCALANMNGKSNTANSLTCEARMPEFITTISSVPPCSAEMFGASPPSVPPGKRLTLILPPALGGHDLGELLHPHHDRVALRILGRELDRALLDVLCGGDANNRARHEGQSGLHQQSFHRASPPLRRFGGEERVGRGTTRPPALRRAEQATSRAWACTLLAPTALRNGRRPGPSGRSSLVHGCVIECVVGDKMCDNRTLDR